MAVHLGSSLSIAGVYGPRAPLSIPGPAPNNARGRRRVSCQATFGAPKPGSQRVREQSPSKVQALAAPAAERELLMSSPPLPPQQAAQAASNILEVRRSELDVRRCELERLLQSEAVPVFEEVNRQQQEQPPPQQDGSAAAVKDAAACDRQQSAAAVSTSGRGQQQQPQQRRYARLVHSTRHARTVATAAAGATQSAPAVSTTPAAAAAPSSPAGTPTALTSWLMDCRSRRERGARQPLAARPRRAATAAAHSRTRLPESAPLQLEASALEGLSEETQADVAMLIKTRASLRSGRRMKGTHRGSVRDVMTAYMGQLGNTTVLTRQHESALAGILQKGLALQRLAEQLAAEAGRKPEAVSDAELAAAAGLPSAADVAQRRANQREAKDLLMQYNVRLVINIAKRYVGNGLDIVDLIPEGMVGLSKSLDRFDASKGFKFSTYAHWWIRQAISRAVCDQARVVRLPSHVCETLYRINRAMATLAEQSHDDEPPSYEAIAAEVGLPVRRVIHYLRLAKLPSGPGSARDRTSQYMSGGAVQNSSLEVMDDVEDEDPTEEGEAEVAAYESMRHTIDLLLSTLEKRERNILRLRYGLLGWGPGESGPNWEESTEAESMSLGEVASAYGLSKERIRQIEDKAMRALRKPWRQQLAQEIRFGRPISPGHLTHLASAQQLAAAQVSWP